MCGKRVIVEPNGVTFIIRAAGVEHIWGTFDLVAFKVILGSFAIIPKIRFSKRCFFYAYHNSFSTKLFAVVPFACLYKQSGILEFWNLNLKKKKEKQKH